MASTAEYAAEWANEARRALTANQETPAAHVERLVAKGFINRRGDVTWVIGGTAEPEPEFWSTR